jgi:glycosyltransferase involved in cell wall biosynthesis
VARRIADSTFVVACHGKEEGPPAVGVWQFLVARRARRLDTIYHPLIREDGSTRRHTVYEPGRPARRRTRRIPAWPPYSYPLDALLPLRPPRADLWIGFNNLLAARGLVEQRVGRVEQVAYWAVDFVPDRFGASPLTRVYDTLDAYCCRHVDHRVELSRAARDARDARHGVPEGSAAATQVVPVGAWLDRIPPAPEDGHAARRVIFIGHLVPRMGLDLGLEALAILMARGVPVHLDVAGHGEHEAELRRHAERLGISERVSFHGFIADQGELARLVSRSSLALAPYEPDPTSFTRFADPSKLKGYLAGGLPILLTDVPPNAEELARDGGAEVLPYEPAAWADAIERGLADPAAWRERRTAALAYARRFDWNVLLEDAFARMGFEA